jgi:branched-chain amino acid aminotransferase
MPQTVIYLDGKFYNKDEAKVSVYDHGLLYGDGIFEGIRIYNGRIFKLEEHIDRLYDSAKAILLDIGMDREEMVKIHVETARKSGYQNAYIRTVITRGVGNLGIDPRKSEKPSIIIICDEIALYPAEKYEKGLKVVTVATQRNGVNMFNASVKSLNYLNNIMGKIEANLAGAGEGIMLNSVGYVTEATADNVFILKNNVIITPPKYLGILAGITRNTIINLAREQGYEVKEDVLTRYDLFVADECFLTGSGAEVIPVVEIDGRVIGDGTPGSVTKKLNATYRDFVANHGTKLY